MKKILRPFTASPLFACPAILLFVLIAAQSLKAMRPSLQAATFNLSTFTPQRAYDNIEMLYSVNRQSGVSNPDFGKIAPGVKPEWYEQYDSRTATSRSFISADGEVVSGNSYTPINYRDKNGNYIAIDPALTPSPGGWSAMHQEFPTFLHADGSTEITLSKNERLKFNVNTSIGGSGLSVNNFTVGDNGMMIYDAVAGIDKKIVFHENKIETDYLLNKPLTRLSADLVISEEIVLPAGYSIKEKSLDELFGEGTNHSEMVVVNSEGSECAHFKMPVCFDSNKDKSKRKESLCLGKYLLRNTEGRIFLDVVIPAIWLNDAARIYPVTIDPIVTGPTTTWAGGYVASCYYPSFNQATIDVNVPANITVTNLFVTANFYADGSTFSDISDGIMYFTTPCGTTSNFQDPTFNYPGWGYITNYDIDSTLFCCLSPSCTSQSLALTYHLSRTWDWFGFYDCNLYYVYYDPFAGVPFQAYIVGRSVEITGGSANWSVSPTSLCSDVCTLTLNAPVSGGNPPYTITHPWASPVSPFGSHSSCRVSAGTASLTLTIPSCPSTCGSAGLTVPPPVVTDACGITISGLVAKNITDNPIPVVTPSPALATVCSGAPVSITNTSCVGGSTITWTGDNGSSGTGNIVNSPVNLTGSPITVNYTVNVSVSGCFGAPVVVPVTVNPGPSISVSPPSGLICNGQSVSLTASGGSTYSWAPSTGLSATTGAVVSASPSTTTIYTVTGTNGGGCSNTSTVTVTLRTPPTISVTPSSATICSGGAPASLTASGASTYSWSPSNNLSATTGATVTAGPPSTYIYTVTGTDVNGCTNTVNVTVNVNSAPTVTVNPSAPSYCNGSFVSLLSSGANTYAWSPSGGLSTTIGSSVTASPTSTATYTVTGTAVNGCTGTSSVVVTVNQPPTISVSPLSPSVCSGGSPTALTASGALTYTWSPGLSSTTGSTVNATTTGTYTVTGTDSQGCTNTKTVTVVPGAAPTITVTPSPLNATACAGQPVSLTASGGVSYSWTPPNGLSSTTGATVTSTSSASLIYTVTGTDASGCTANTNVSITINQLPNVNVSPGSPSVCSGGTPASLTASGASTYTWSAGLSATTGTTVSATNTGTYTVTGTDALGCTNTKSVTVGPGTPPTIIITPNPLNASACTGQSVSLTAGGGSSYAWSAGLSANIGTTVSATASGTYTVTGTNASGCTNTSTVTVTINPLPVISVSPPSPSVCSGGTQTALTASGAFTYIWSPGLSATSGATVAASATGTYTVTGTDSHGCTATKSVTVSPGAPPTISVTPDPLNATVCSGQSVSLTAAGGSTYAWSAGLSANTGTTVSATASGTYTVTGTSVNGCTSTATAVVSVSAPISISAGSDAHICPGGSALLNLTGAPGGSTIDWMPPTDLTCNDCANPTANPANTTIYIVTVTNAAGCSAKDTIEVDVSGLLITTGLHHDDTLICAGSSIQFNGGGAADYVWGPSTTMTCSNCPNPIAFVLSATTYTVTGTSGNCSGTATVTVNTYPLLITPTITQFPSAHADTLVCSTETNYTVYEWYINDTLLSETTNKYIARRSGDYHVTVRDGNGCSTSVGARVDITVGVHAVSSDNSVFLYPNPAGNELSIKSGELRIEKIELYNVVGEKIRSESSEIIKPKSEIRIDVSNLSAGIYFIQLHHQQGKWIGRFVKE